MPPKKTTKETEKPKTTSKTDEPMKMSIVSVSQFVDADGNGQLVYVERTNDQCKGQYVTWKGDKVVEKKCINNCEELKAIQLKRSTTSSADKGEKKTKKKK